MGQVPNLTYGIVGDGRLARHFAHYFSLLQIPFRQWSRRQQTGQGSPGRIGAIEVLKDCDIILVMITDSAIEPWIASIQSAFSSSKRFVHFSGALVTPLAAGFHPLMTFGYGVYELGEYQSIPFIGEREGMVFSEIFPALPNPYYTVPANKKALYHALCVMSGNFTVLLWQKMFADLETLGVKASAAVPYLERVTRNLKTDPERALTGPLARGDQKTIEKNIESLTGDRFQKIYEAFVEAHSS